MKTIDKILLMIKQHGPQTAKQIATSLDMTTMGARQHLQKLELKGTLHSYTERVKVGRPNRYWALTEEGTNECFADNHSILSVQLIDAIDEIYGQEGLQKLIDKRESKTLTRYKRAIDPLATLEEKLNKLIELREEEGYLVLLEKEDETYILYENHCPICCAARRCPELCTSEQNIFTALIKDLATITREENIVSGQRRCAYKIVPLDTDK